MSFSHGKMTSTEEVETQLQVVNQALIYFPGGRFARVFSRSKVIPAFYGLEAVLHVYFMHASPSSDLVPGTN